MKPLVLLFSCIAVIGACNPGQHSSTGITAVSVDTMADLPPGLFSSLLDPWNRRVDQADTALNSPDIINNLSAVDPDLSHQFIFAELSVPYYVVNNAPLVVKIYGDPNGVQGGNYSLPVDTQTLFPELSGKKPQISDPHLLITDIGTKKLYELYGPDSAGPELWKHNGAAFFDLTKNEIGRADGYTSADAAGLPILPGLLRYDELRAGVINHALRITIANNTGLNAHLGPAATHHPTNQQGYKTGDVIAWLPTGARLRLRANVSEAHLSPGGLAIVHCLKTYGAVVADIGKPFAISGAQDLRFRQDAVMWRADTTNGKISWTLRLSDSTGNRDIRWGDFQVIKMDAANIDTLIRNLPTPTVKARKN